MELYPIFDRVARRRAMVNSERYEQERAALGRLLRSLAKPIPADAKEVLEAYPFVEVKEMYQEVTEALTTSGQRYARGELAAAGFWAREASQFTGIEAKAHERFLQEGVWSYVGKRVGLAVIGFFAGAAEAMVGLVDSGASLIGFHPDLEGKIAARNRTLRGQARGEPGHRQGDRPAGQDRCGDQCGRGWSAASVPDVAIPPDLA